MAKGAEELKEIPCSLRFLFRPTLQDLLCENQADNRKQRNEVITEAVQVHGYSQKEVADYLELHYCTISRILAKEREKVKKQDLPPRIRAITGTQHDRISELVCLRTLVYLDSGSVTMLSTSSPLTLIRGTYILRLNLGWHVLVT